MTKYLALIFAVFTFTESAHAGVGLLGGASFNNVSVSNSGSNTSYNGSSKAGFIGGLAFSSDMPLVNLELDALYDNRTLSSGNGNGVSSPAINVPILARFSLIPALLDFGIGPYGSFNVGHNDLGYNSPDFGAVASIRIDIPIPVVHLVLDGRYDFGFTNLTDIPGVSVHTREFQILAGINVPVGQ